MSYLPKFMGAAVLSLMLAQAAGADETAKPSADTVVATVNGTEITLGQMITVRDGLPPQYLALDDKTLFDGILEQLVQQTALAQIGEGRMTQRDHIALEVQRRGYLAGSLLNYTANTAVNDETLKQAYEAKYAKADPVREFHAAHIIVDTQEEAVKLHDEIKAGADFAEVAKANSTDGAAANGGDLGWFNLSDMVEPFGEAVAGMKPGDIAGPVQTQYGWHVIRLIDARIADAPSIDDVREELEDDIRQQAVEKRVTEAVDNAKVEMKDTDLDPAILKDETILGN